jgi:hypothetical protein
MAATWIAHFRSRCVASIDPAERKRGKRRKAHVNDAPEFRLCYTPLADLNDAVRIRKAEREHALSHPKSPHEQPVFTASQVMNLNLNLVGEADFVARHAPDSPGVTRCLKDRHFDIMWGNTGLLRNTLIEFSDKQLLGID